MSASSPLSLEEAAAEFIVRYSGADVDDEARRAAKTLIKDQLAIQVGASRLPWSRQLRSARALRPGKATIVGDAETAAAEDAVFLNATYGHGFEYDDYAGNAHPGCTVVPVAIAIGEELGASFEEVLVAMVTGYELYVRIGYLGSPALLNQGWQSHSVLANFGAAAIAAKLRGLDAETTFHALAIALSYAGGTTEYASTGGSIKRVHAGISARNGMEAVDLAAAGITGPRKFLTGRRGLYRMFTATEIADDAQDIFDTSRPAFISQLSMKPYCCCAATHVYIDLMEQVAPRVAEIERIEARIQSMTDAIVGRGNAAIYSPQNIEQVQYSLTIQMALAALGRGNGYATHLELMKGELWGEEPSPVVEFAKRISLEISPELDREFPRTFAGSVTVHYADGSRQDLSVDHAKGTPERPFTPQEIESKFFDLTDGVLGREAARRLYDAVDEVDGASPITALTSLLSAR